MTLPIAWRASALEDVRQIVRFIARRNPSAAQRIRSLIEACVIPAATFPYMFKASQRIPGCHEIVAHPNYIVIYRITDCIEVMAVVHARQARMPEVNRA